ncbi:MULTISPECIES: hypothetical protein [Streptomyces]|uniref:Uncharacterized protein n=1 Tax=Streptomyces alboflavus TaxID=67267 RepID=A0A1Z1WC01_9ACTN|nr:hypothetical protein [Streptomyces alboflavus]ARX83900.1 hypothetical protein SMD44_03330 [Streptomyces alboflavus]
MPAPTPGTQTNTISTPGMTLRVYTVDRDGAVTQDTGTRPPTAASRT